MICECFHRMPATPHPIFVYFLSRCIISAPNDYFMLCIDASWWCLLLVHPDEPSEGSLSSEPLTSEPCERDYPSVTEGEASWVLFTGLTQMLSLTLVPAFNRVFHLLMFGWFNEVTLMRDLLTVGTWSLIQVLSWFVGVEMLCADLVFGNWRLHDLLL